MTDLDQVRNFWESNLHFFPVVLHRCLDKNLGFMIYASVRKL